MYKTYFLLFIIVCLPSHPTEFTHRQKIEEYLKLTSYYKLYEAGFYKGAGGYTKENKKTFKMLDTLIIQNLTNEFMKVWNEEETSQILNFIKSKTGKHLTKQIKLILENKKYDIPKDEMLKITQFNNSEIGRKWKSGLNVVRNTNRSLLMNFIKSKKNIP